MSNKPAESKKVFVFNNGGTPFHAFHTLEDLGELHNEGNAEVYVDINAFTELQKERDALANRVVELTSPYCPACGSCGEDMCCPAKGCKYPTNKANDELKKLADESCEELQLERDKLAAELQAAKDEIERLKSQMDQASLSEMEAGEFYVVYHKSHPDPAEHFVNKFKCLTKQNQIYKTALEFYADKDNWTLATAQSCSTMIGPDDHYGVSNTDKYVAGFQAKKALADAEALKGVRG